MTKNRDYPPRCKFTMSPTTYSYIPYDKLTTDTGKEYDIPVIGDTVVWTEDHFRGRTGEVMTHPFVVDDKHFCDKCVGVKVTTNNITHLLIWPIRKITIVPPAREFTFTVTATNEKEARRMVISGKGEVR